MDHTFEKYFVNTFIIKSRRERLLYELTKKEKRYDGVSRFCHQAGQLINPSKIFMEGDDIDRSTKFIDFVNEHDEICLVLSPDSYLDGQFFPLKDAVVRAGICPDAAIILGSTFAIVFAEPMKGGRDKYLLSEN